MMDGDEEKETDQWDKYSYFNGIDRKEFKPMPEVATFRERNEEGNRYDGKYYFKENGCDESMAREENFFRSICLCACPYIGWLKFITIISFSESPKPQNPEHLNNFRYNIYIIYHYY